jgi:ribonuclease HII
VITIKKIKKHSGKPVYAGIDEAGRGPVIGPLVVGLIAGDEIDQINEHFINAGVKDSKKLSRKKRSELYNMLIDNDSIGIYTAIIEAEDIDRERKNISLNDIEIKMMGGLIELLKPEYAYIDACSSNAENFGTAISEKIKHHTKIIAEHKADERYPIVSGASIIAKVCRDLIIEDIKKKVQYDFGSGYPSDPKTIKYISEPTGNDSKYVRHSWKTITRSKNMRVDDYDSV